MPGQLPRCSTGVKDQPFAAQAQAPDYVHKSLQGPPTLQTPWTDNQNSAGCSSTPFESFAINYANLTNLLPRRGQLFDLAHTDTHAHMENIRCCLPVCQFACLPSTGWHHDLHGYGCLRRLNVSKWKGIYMSAPVVTKWRMGWAWVWSKCKFKGVNKPAANGGTLIVDNPRNYPLWKSH